MFFTVTWAVTVVPGVSVPLGIPLAVTLELLNLTVPLSVAWVSPEYTSSPGRKNRPLATFTRQTPGRGLAQTSCTAFVLSLSPKGSTWLKPIWLSTAFPFGSTSWPSNR